MAATSFSHQGSLSQMASGRTAGSVGVLISLSTQHQVRFRLCNNKGTLWSKLISILASKKSSWVQRTFPLTLRTGVLRTCSNHVCDTFLWSVPMASKPKMNAGRRGACAVKYGPDVGMMRMHLARSSIRLTTNGWFRGNLEFLSALWAF